MFSPEAARAILATSYDADAVARMNALAEKARLGTLDASEREELDACERAGHLLGVLQSQARVALRGMSVE